MDGIYRLDRYRMDRYKCEYIREIMGVEGMSDIENKWFCWYGHEHGNRTPTKGRYAGVKLTHNRRSGGE